MVNDIITAVTKKINSHYGDGLKVYESNVKQGLETPCFFVKLVTSPSKQYLWKRKKLEYLFDIHYFPEDETDNADMMEVGEQLVYLLEFITLPSGELNHGREMSYQIIDGVLHFSVTYSVIVNDITKDEVMETCETEVRA